jgi:hypothetical protein
MIEQFNNKEVLDNQKDEGLELATPPSSTLGITYNKQGEIEHPKLWVGNWEMNFDNTFKDALILCGNNQNESEEHRKLKAFSLVLLGQVWGIEPKEATLEDGTDKKIRPDVSCYINHKKKKVAIEIGELGYRYKIKHLLTEYDYDYVLWIPFSENTQEHYFNDVDFFYDALRAHYLKKQGINISSFECFHIPLYIAKKDNSLYVATYKTIDSLLPQKEIKTFWFEKNVEDSL